MTTTGVSGDKKRRCLKRILIIGFLIVLIYCIVSMIASYVICDLIFARSEEKDLLSSTYESYTDPYPRSRFSFTSGENTLVGYLYRAVSPRGVVLVAHGMHGSSDSHLSEAFYFLDQGFCVVAFDGTGAGESTGDSTVGLEQMVRDLRAALDWVSGQETLCDLPLLLYGHSMGGYAAAVLSEDERVSAVISVSGFDSPMDIMLDRGREYAGEAAVLGYPFLCLQNKLTFGADADKSAVDAINRAQTPILLIYGSDDDVVSEEDSLYGAREDITNTRAWFYYVSDEGRNGHSGLWFSAEAMAYRAELEAEASILSARYGGEIPVDVLAEFYDKIECARLYELDESYMYIVMSFYNSALQYEKSLG